MKIYHGHICERSRSDRIICGPMRLPVSSRTKSGSETTTHGSGSTPSERSCSAPGASRLTLLLRSTSTACLPNIYYGRWPRLSRAGRATGSRRVTLRNSRLEMFASFFPFRDGLTHLFFGILTIYTIYNIL